VEAEWATGEDDLQGSQPEHLKRTQERDKSRVASVAWALDTSGAKEPTYVTGESGGIISHHTGVTSALQFKRHLGWRAF
jgi:hypothetical protein